MPLMALLMLLLMALKLSKGSLLLMALLMLLLMALKLSEQRQPACCS